MDRLVRAIKAVSVKNKSEGSIGFLTEEEDKHWYNVSADPSILDSLLGTMIQKGNVVEFEVNNGFPMNFTLKEKAQKEDNWADDMISFEELLNDAHTKFKDKFSIKTECISVDYEKKRALFKAVVIVDSPTQEEFVGHGDAEGIASTTIQPHFIRMAETRAIARALRWATNNAAVAEEETSK